MAFVSAFLGLEHLHHLSRYGPAAKGRELGGAVCAEHDFTAARLGRSEEHTSELQSQSNLVCRLLLEKKKIKVLVLLRDPRAVATPPLPLRPGLPAVQWLPVRAPSQALPRPPMPLPLMSPEALIITST